MISDVNLSVKENDCEWNVFINEFGNIIRIRKWNPYSEKENSVYQVEKLIGYKMTPTD